MTETNDIDLPAFFLALSDPTRLEVVLRLAGSPRPQTVTEITSCCGVHISGVSRHLAKLRRAGLVSAEKSGREVRYTLNTKDLAALLRRIAEMVERCCDDVGYPETR
ncbi:MAG: ArsR/SmtB family transcription factor [Planctomycetota bacterium]|jgi:DNA-binding transcriptional ArsR family regulator